MSEKHTPGPWKVNIWRDEDWEPYHAELVDSQDISLTAKESLPELEANARLIAAAPEMLAALETLNAMLWSDGPRDGSEKAWEIVKRQTESAISAAKGK